MSTAVQRRRGTTAQHASFAGLNGELTVDTDKEVVVVHDGATAGGYPMMRENGSNSALALGSAGTPSLKFTGDPNTGIYSPGADQVAISTNGTRRLVILSDGKVGLGAASVLQQGSGVDGGSAAGVLELYNGGTGNTTLENTGAFPILFKTNGSERLRITSAGLVGVGTSSPGANLTVQSAFDAIAFRTETGSAAPRFTVNNNSQGVIVDYYDSAGNIKNRIDARANFPSYFTAGNVGIGTSSPANAMLHVSSGTASAAIKSEDTGSTGSFVRILGDSSSQNLINWKTGTALRFASSDDNYGSFAERLRIDSSGRVGIGTSSPSQALTVAVADAAQAVQLRGTTGYLRMRPYVDATNGAIIDSANAAENAYVPLTLIGSTLRLFGNNASGITVNTTGQVGIGTASPGALVHIFASNSGATASGTLVVEQGSSPSIQLLSANNQTQQIRFGDPESNTIGRIEYSHNDDSLRFVANSGERARIDSSGRLLVGTSSSTGANSYTGLVVKSITNSNSPGEIILQNGYSNALNANSSLGSLLFQDGSGDTYAQIKAQVDAQDSASGDFPGRLVFSTTADGASSPTERMRIPSSGGLLINATSRINDGLTTISFQGSIQKGLVLNDTDPANTRQFIGFHISDTTQIGYIANSNNTGVTYSTSSDYRLKENVTPVTDGIARLQQLKPSRFNFIAAPGCTVDGFIAHEVQSVVPEAITGEKDAVDADGKPQYQGIDQSKLVPLLTAALQEAVAKIESLEARLTAAGI